MTKEQREVAVTVVITTTDERLFPENMDVSTPRSTAILRRAVLANVRNITRVVCVMPVSEAKLMMAARDLAMAQLGLEPDDRPPLSYVPPTRD